VTFEDHLRVRVSSRRRGGITCECLLRPDLKNGAGILHGGVSAAIADEAAWHLLVHLYGKDRPCTTTDLKINYLRPINGRKVAARAEAVRAGKTFLVSRVDLLDDQKNLCAAAIVTYMLLDRQA
jgi:uncharacterized protein (TIGR00369 family)